MTNDATSRRSRHAFTLVEMLTVIIIIGILASLMLVAFGAARKTARLATIKMDVSQLEMALESYRQQYGDYPPDFIGCNYNLSVPNDPVRLAARGVVLRHLRKRFPRFTIPDLVTGANTDQFDDFVELVRRATTDDNQHGQGLCRNLLASPQSGESGDGPGIDISGMTPSQTLVFWFNGLPRYRGSNELTGLSANVANPFVADTVASSRTPRSFDFDARRLFIDANTGCIGYGSTTVQGGDNLVGYAYFHPVGNPYVLDNNNNVVRHWYHNLVWQTAYRPYIDSSTYNTGNLLLTRWMYTGKVQIISAGLDGDFGAISPSPPPPPVPSPLTPLAPLFPASSNFSGEAHNDNVANFAEAATLGDDIEGQ